MKKIQIIRALWGNDSKFFNEIPKQPIFDEVVYVWGLENENYLKTLGYKTILISEISNKYGELTKLKNKLECLSIASNDYPIFLFLDWDIRLIKNLDDDFYLSFENKEFLMPTYAYPIEYLDLKNKLNDINANLWTNKQIDEMKKYGWRYNDLIILPNAGFVYSNNSKIPNKLFEISNNITIETLVDEFAMYIFANIDLEGYILNYEPSVIYGRPSENRFILSHIDKMCERELHNKIEKMINKKIYLVHE